MVVAAFLLLRMEGELRALREAIDRLRYCQICRFSPIAEPGSRGEEARS
ncbi:MAG: YvrJ family protein [Synergistaceae bacterium]|nr:YvrJ family protein [Synergistaceae bacterium]